MRPRDGIFWVLLLLESSSGGITRASERASAPSFSSLSLSRQPTGHLSEAPIKYPAKNISKDLWLLSKGENTLEEEGASQPANQPTSERAEQT